MTWTTRQLNEIQRAATYELMGDANVFGVRIRRRDADPTLQIACAADASALGARPPALFLGLLVVCREGQLMVLAYPIAR